MSFWNNIGKFIDAISDASAKFAEETDKLPELGRKARQQMTDHVEKWLEEEKDKNATSHKDQ